MERASIHFKECSLTYALTSPQFKKAVHKSTSDMVHNIFIHHVGRILWRCLHIRWIRGLLRAVACGWCAAIVDNNADALSKLLRKAIVVTSQFPWESLKSLPIQICFRAATNWYTFGVSLQPCFWQMIPKKFSRGSCCNQRVKRWVKSKSSFKPVHSNNKALILICQPLTVRGCLSRGLPKCHWAIQLMHDSREARCSDPSIIAYRNLSSWFFGVELFWLSKILSILSVNRAVNLASRGSSWMAMRVGSATETDSLNTCVAYFTLMSATAAGWKSALFIQRPCVSKGHLVDMLLFELPWQSFFFRCSVGVLEAWFASIFVKGFNVRPVNNLGANRELVFSQIIPRAFYQVWDVKHEV